MGKGKKTKGQGASPKITSPVNKLKHSKSKESKPSLIYFIGIGAVVAMASVAIAMGVKWYFTPTLATPLNLPSVINDEMTKTSQYEERLWGSYRSNVYFGMRPRLPRSVIAGLAWINTMSVPTGELSLQIRHMCEHGDNLRQYGWTKHDGRQFGQQDIIDSYMKINTQFITHSKHNVGHSWTARIRAESTTNQPVPLSLLFYVFTEDTDNLKYTLKNGVLQSVTGSHDKIGDFKFTISSITNHSTPPKFGYLATDLYKISLLSQFVKTVIEKEQSLQLPGERYMFPDSSKDARLVVYQILGSSPIELEVVYSSGSDKLPLKGEMFSREFDVRMKEFDDRFEKIFKLKQKGFSESHISFAKAAFSNLIGSISYFYGSSRVMAPGMKKPKSYFPAPLYTGVPSRSFFPRGFLWDEGFHQLLVTSWDVDIVKDVLGHWLDLLNADGWIPREQILGEEAISKVPEEFITQHSSNGNPPALFLTVEVLLNKMERENIMDIGFIKRVYSRLKIWFNWFQTTQKGSKPSTYRWRGRNSTTDRELNSKTLASGLDDYPRASHPTNEEYHLDLRCWMALATRVLVRMADILNESSKKYKDLSEELSNMKLLDKLHWDNERKMYSDFGNHTSKVKLVVNRDINPPVRVRKVIKPPRLKFVNSFGYVNLFPFLMTLLPPDSAHLEATLQHLSNESLLWTKYGLRSLAKTDPFYNKANTGQDSPYWRGAIWINMNYLAVRALHYYGNHDGPYQSLANELYIKLRSNIIETIYNQYLTTGYIWEQYDDRNGKGKGTHPFTGWSSLVVLIMAEHYD